MSRTLIATGKIGPAFPALDAEVKVVCISCKADYITYKSGAMFGENPLDFSARIFGTCDNCENLRRNVARKYTGLRGFFDEADAARQILSHGTMPHQIKSFTMCTCPDGRECNSCK